MSALPDFPARAGAWVTRQVLGRLAPGGGRGLSILIYHRVLARPDPLFPCEVDRAAFARQMRWLAASHTVLPLLQAVRLARAGQLPPRAACITFDDGYADNATEAWPVLQQLGLSATIFVASGFLDGGRMWNDSVIELVRRAPGPWFDAGAVGLGVLPLDGVDQRRAAVAALIGHLKYLPMAQRTLAVQQLVDGAGLTLPGDLMLRSDQLLALHRAGIEIGAHTVRHPILAALDQVDARDEIVRGKQALESLLGAPVPLFAYPNGRPGTDYLARHVTLVRQAGFEGAVSTSAGSGLADLWQLPRFTPWDRRQWRFNLRLARNLRLPCATV
jgi:peptidoglycan/xylan/chitin deacetylase (PgdA/CDA1 family)